MLTETRRVVLSFILPCIAMSAAFFFFGLPEVVILFIQREILSDYPLYVFSLEEGLFLKIRIALLCGAALSSPIALAMIYRTSHVLRLHSRIVALSLVPFFFLFCLGIAFGYLVLLPTMLSFFLGETLLVAEPQMNLSLAVDLVVVTLLLFGVSFEFPLAASILAHLHVVSPKTFLRYWRHAVVLIIVWAGFVTPDVSPVTQSMVALPMIALYFLGAACALIFY
jgi:sec-independent protein translocase protein TatC